MIADHDAHVIRIRDVTLRDGEQTPNVAFSPAEKVQIASVLLTKVGVDTVEIASARVSPGEADAVRRISSWARGKGLADRVEILAYCDGQLSVDWALANGCCNVALLTKGSERHCRAQLGLRPAQHFERIRQTVGYARERNVRVNGVYLEDWSRGAVDSYGYVCELLETLRELGVPRAYLADTLGILTPELTRTLLRRLCAEFPQLEFEFHTHNDYGLAIATSLAAVGAGARGLHASVNGLGERAGNASLAALVAALHDHTEFQCRVDERELSSVSQLVELASGKYVAANAPVVGADVFTQTAGIHADGDSKGSLYEGKLSPLRFGKRRTYALGKLSGRASLEQNLKQLGIELTPEDQQRVLSRIIELGDHKHHVMTADLPYLIADVLRRPSLAPVRVAHYRIVQAADAPPEAAVELEIEGRRVSARSTGSGGYDAFVRAVTVACESVKLSVPALTDYRVRIPPGGQSSALVQTMIWWQGSAGAFSTSGVHADQMAAAVIATERMLCLSWAAAYGAEPSAESSSTVQSEAAEAERGAAYVPS